MYDPGGAIAVCIGMGKHKDRDLKTDINQMSITCW
jgi:hypothetical protein